MMLGHHIHVHNHHHVLIDKTQVPHSVSWLPHPCQLSVQENQGSRRIQRGLQGSQRGQRGLQGSQGGQAGGVNEQFQGFQGFQGVWEEDSRSSFRVSSQFFSESDLPSKPGLQALLLSKAIFSKGSLSSSIPIITMCRCHHWQTWPTSYKKIITMMIINNNKNNNNNKWYLYRCHHWQTWPTSSSPLVRLTSPRTPGRCSI